MGENGWTSVHSQSKMSKKMQYCCNFSYASPWYMTVLENFPLLGPVTTTMKIMKPLGESHHLKKGKGNRLENGHYAVWVLWMLVLASWFVALLTSELFDLAPGGTSVPGFWTWIWFLACPCQFGLHIQQDLRKTALQCATHEALEYQMNSII